MYINYKIAADVVDIRNDSPIPEDVFLVDSNVWYWMSYTRASLVTEPWASYRIQNYPSFLNKAIAKGVQLYQCGLSFSELAHIIEKSEREIYEKSHGKIGPKEFRHNHPTERSDVVAEVNAAWGQVKSMASSLDVTIDGALTDAALFRFGQECTDGYDLFILEAMSKSGVIQVITDDGDFATVPGISVFTANQNVITSAQQQNKLIIR